MWLILSKDIQTRIALGLFKDRVWCFILMIDILYPRGNVVLIASQKVFKNSLRPAFPPLPS